MDKDIERENSNFDQEEIKADDFFLTPTDQENKDLSGCEFDGWAEYDTLLEGSLDLDEVIKGKDRDYSKDLEQTDSALKKREEVESENEESKSLSLDKSESESEDVQHVDNEINEEALNSSEELTNQDGSFVLEGFNSASFELDDYEFENDLEEDHKVSNLETNTERESSVLNKDDKDIPKVENVHDQKKEEDSQDLAEVKSEEKESEDSSSKDEKGESSVVSDELPKAENIESKSKENESKDVDEARKDEEESEDYSSKDEKGESSDVSDELFKFVDIEYKSKEEDSEDLAEAKNDEEENEDSSSRAEKGESSDVSDELPKAENIENISKEDESEDEAEAKNDEEESEDSSFRDEKGESSDVSDELFKFVDIENKNKEEKSEDVAETRKGEEESEDSSSKDEKRESFDVTDELPKAENIENKSKEDESEDVAEAKKDREESKDSSFKEEKGEKRNTSEVTQYSISKKVREKAKKILDEEESPENKMEKLSDVSGTGITLFDSNNWTDMQLVLRRSAKNKEGLCDLKKVGEILKIEIGGELKPINETNAKTIFSNNYVEFLINTVDHLNENPDIELKFREYNKEIQVKWNENSKWKSLKNSTLLKENEDFFSEHFTAAADEILAKDQSRFSGKLNIYTLDLNGKKTFIRFNGRFKAQKYNPKDNGDLTKNGATATSENWSSVIEDDELMKMLKKLYNLSLN